MLELKPEVSRLLTFTIMVFLVHLRVTEHEQNLDLTVKGINCLLYLMAQEFLNHFHTVFRSLVDTLLRRMNKESDPRAL